MKRGDIVSIVSSGDYGKPRPAIIIQSDYFSQTASVTILPLTSHLIDAPLMRVSIKPTNENGLKKESQIMVDKLLTIPREKVGKIIGKINQTSFIEVERALVLFLGIAK